MKKITIYTFIMCALSLTFPCNAIASDMKPLLTNAPSNIQSTLQRLDKIKDMDKTNLSKTEKKEIRKEVRQIKSTLRNSGTGIYISVGGAIIILLLLIIIL